VVDCSRLQSSPGGGPDDGVDVQMHFFPIHLVLLP
jgi:hypothetical protein